MCLCQNDFTCADQLRQCGQSFIAADHYAVDCIRPKCCELQRISDEFAERLSHRQQTLDLSLRLHQHLDKVMIIFNLFVRVQVGLKEQGSSVGMDSPFLGTFLNFQL